MKMDINKESTDIYNLIIENSTEIKYITEGNMPIVFFGYLVGTN